MQAPCSRTPSTPARDHGAASSIQYGFGLSLATIRQRIENGTTDYGPVPAAAHQELDTLYGPNSEAAAHGLQQWFANSSPSIRHLSMNTERPLFQHPERVNLRKAVNFAIDRPAIIAQRGYAAGPASDQLIPPGVPGFVDEDIYPLDGPDIVQARLLAGWQPG